MGRATGRSGVRGPALIFMMLLSGIAHADDGEPPPQPPRALPDTSNLDGNYLWLGPTASAIDIAGEWDASFGGEIAAVRVREHRPLAVTGLALGATRYSKRDGGRLWLEGLAGTRKVPGRLLLGVSAGPAVELSRLEHVRLGVTGSLWSFFGPTVYVRGGWFAEAGGYVEVGLAIELPVLRR